MMRRTRDERGSISIWLAVSSLVMMILVGLAVDLGGQVHAKQRAHDIAAEAVHTGRTVREVAGERTDLPAEQLDEILDPIRLARGLGQTCRERQE